MDMSGIPFGTTDWSAVEATEHKGETGTSWWRTREFGLRPRLGDQKLSRPTRRPQRAAGGHIPNKKPLGPLFRPSTRIRVRMVEYSAGYLADHWCSKGHVLLCLEGELHTELKDGRRFVLRPGMSYQVADNAEPHRSHTAVGAKLFIVD